MLLREITGLTDAQMATVATIPPHFRLAYVKGCKGSRAMAIKAFCLECLGYERSAIRDCPSGGCALWAFRPYQRKR